MGKPLKKQFISGQTLKVVSYTNRLLIDTIDITIYKHKQISLDFTYVYKYLLFNYRGRINRKENTNFGRNLLMILVKILTKFISNSRNTRNVC